MLKVERPAGPCFSVEVFLEARIKKEKGKRIL